MDRSKWSARGFLAVLTLLSVAGGSAGSAVDRYTAYAGTAVDLHSRRFLYGERHWLRRRDDGLAERVVLYTCSDGSPFARKSIEYVDQMAPDFLLEDASTGVREGIRSSGSGRSVFFRAGGLAAEKAASLPRVPGLVADAGFDEFIRANWLPLVRGEPMTLRFLVPSRLKDTTFVVRHPRKDTFEGTPVDVFTLQPAGPLSWFVPSIEVSYRTEDRLLIRYRGLTDLRDASGGNIQAQIIYGPGDRRASDAEAMAASRQARLAPCSHS